MEFEQTYLKKRGMDQDYCVITWSTSQMIVEEEQIGRAHV